MDESSRNDTRQSGSRSREAIDMDLSSERSAEPVREPVALAGASSSTSTTEGTGAVAESTSTGTGATNSAAAPGSAPVHRAANSAKQSRQHGKGRGRRAPPAKVPGAVAVNKKPSNSSPGASSVKNSSVSRNHKRGLSNRSSGNLPKKQTAKAITGSPLLVEDSRTGSDLPDLQPQEDTDDRIFQKMGYEPSSIPKEEEDEQKSVVLTTCRTSPTPLLASGGLTSEELEEDKQEDNILRDSFHDEDEELGDPLVSRSQHTGHIISNPPPAMSAESADCLANQLLVEAYVVPDDGSSTGNGSTANITGRARKSMPSRCIPEKNSDKCFCFGIFFLVTLVALGGLIAGIVCGSGSCTNKNISSNQKTSSATSTGPAITDTPTAAPSPKATGFNSPTPLDSLFLPVATQPPNDNTTTPSLGTASLSNDTAITITNSTSTSNTTTETPLTPLVTNANESTVESVAAPIIESRTDLDNAVSEWIENGTSIYGQIGDWDVSRITNFDRLFKGRDFDDGSINNWDVSHVTSMSKTFDAWESKKPYNQPLDNWDLRSVISTSHMFANSPYNHPLDSFNMSSVTDLESMFAASAFNQDISNWDVSSGRIMRGLFRLSRFNQPLNEWDISNAQDLSMVFYANTVFDQALDNWKVENVRNFNQM